MRSRKATVAMLGRHLRRTGANVEEEAAIHELYIEEEDGQIRKKFMGMEVRWARGKRYLIDMTVQGQTTLNDQSGSNNRDWRERQNPSLRARNKTDCFRDVRTNKGNGPPTARKIE